MNDALSFDAAKKCLSYFQSILRGTCFPQHQRWPFLLLLSLCISFCGINPRLKQRNEAKTNHLVSLTLARCAARRACHDRRQHDCGSTHFLRIIMSTAQWSHSQTDPLNSLRGKKLEVENYILEKGLMHSGQTFCNVRQMYLLGEGRALQSQPVQQQNNQPALLGLTGSLIMPRSFIARHIQLIGLFPRFSRTFSLLPPLNPSLNQNDLSHRWVNQTRFDTFSHALFVQAKAGRAWQILQKMAERYPACTTLLWWDPSERQMFYFAPAVLQPTHGAGAGEEWVRSVNKNRLKNKTTRFKEIRSRQEWDGHKEEPVLWAKAKSMVDRKQGDCRWEWTLTGSILSGQQRKWKRETPHENKLTTVLRLPYLGKMR